MTQNITLSDYFLSAQPFDLFGALQPGYSGIEISFDGKENRLLSLPNDVSTEGIRDALLTEFDFYTKVRAALRQAFALAPFKKGAGFDIEEILIKGADFAVTNRRRADIIAVYASESIDGTNRSFINRLLTGSENVKTLILVTSRWPKDVAFPEGVLSAKVELFPGRDISRLAEITADYFYDKIARDEALNWPPTATFKPKKRPGEGQST